MIIQSENQGGRDNIKNAIENEMSETYEIKVPSEIEVVIVITYMTYEEKELIEKLIKQNQVMENIKINLIKIYETRRNNRLIYNAKLEINSESYQKVIATKN